MDTDEISPPMSSGTHKSLSDRNGRASGYGQKRIAASPIAPCPSTRQTQRRPSARSPFQRLCWRGATRPPLGLSREQVLGQFPDRL